MSRRLLFLGALLTLFASTASAAPMKGTVASIQKLQVRVVVQGKLEDWVKKGAKVRFLGMKGTVLGVASDTVSISSPKAGTTKVGATVTLEKPRAGVSGC